MITNQLLYLLSYAGNLVLLPGNDPSFHPYQGCVIPLYYKSKWHWVQVSILVSKIHNLGCYHYTNPANWCPRSDSN